MKYWNSQLYTRASSGGQGAIGFIIAVAFFVVPAAVAVNYLARVGDAKHKTYEAVRYSAWERTVWHQADDRYNIKSDEDINWELIQRVFGAQNSVLDSVEDRRRRDPDDIQYDANLYAWGRNNNQRISMVETPAGNNTQPTNLGIDDRVAPGEFSNVINRGASLLGLDRNGFYHAEISLQIYRERSLLEQFDAALGQNSPLRTTSTNAMLVGAWNANGPADVTALVRRTMPSSLLDNGVMDAMSGAASFVGFEEFDELEFGKVDPERVPCQRLRTPSRMGRGC